MTAVRRYSELYKIRILYNSGYIVFKITAKTAAAAKNHPAKPRPYQTPQQQQKQEKTYLQSI